MQGNNNSSNDEVIISQPTSSSDVIQVEQNKIIADDLTHLFDDAYISDQQENSNIVDLVLQSDLNKVSVKRQIMDITIAIGAASKGILGMGLLASQLSDEGLESIVPIVAMIVGALGGVGFYRSQAHLGIDLWAKIFSCKPSVSTVQPNSENTLLLPENRVLSARLKTKLLVILGSLGFSMVQAMSIILAGGSNKTSYALAATGGVSNLVISPGNMISFLNQINLLKTEEIEFLAPKDLAQPSSSIAKKILTILYALTGSGTNIASGTAFFLQLAVLAYMADKDALIYTIPTVAASIILSTLCSAVAIGMNIDGANKTAADVTQAGGWGKFFLGEGRIAFLLFIAIANSLPSNYTGILSSSQTAQNIAKIFGYNGVITLDTMIREHQLPKDSANISINASLVLVFTCGFMAQTLNKAPAAKQLLVDIGSVLVTIGRSVKSCCLFSAKKIFSVFSSPFSSSPRTALVFNKDSIQSNSAPHTPTNS